MSTPANAAESPSARQRWLEIGLILLVFYLNSGWGVPDNNEAHYLGKARHYWDPTYCAGDAFFESAHTHQVFYVLLGWWTLFLPLPAVAWIGRLLTWSLLAAGWQRLSWRFVARPWWSVLSAALMVALQERFQVAGEWLVGGFEAKGIAYALVFFGLDAAFAGKWRSVWLWLGAASAWHVLVGGWSVVAMLFAWYWEYRRGAAPSFRVMVPALTLGLFMAMPALVPALELTRGASADVIAAANQIYVFERLPHHLNPLSFPTRWIVMLIGLFVTTGVLAHASPATAALRIVWRFAMAAAGLYLLGWLIAVTFQAWPDRAAAMLKFYWFRLADVAIPVAASLIAMAYLQRALRASPSWGRAWFAVIALFAAFHVIDFGIQTQCTPYPRADRPGKVLDHHAWVEVCEWIRKNTPEGSRFITPRQNQTFKWYAERAEVATWKDVPQDAMEIVQWKKKLDELYDNDGKWYDRLRKLGWGDQGWLKVCRLGQSMGAQYLVLDVDAVGPVIYNDPDYDPTVVIDDFTGIVPRARFQDTTNTYFVYELTVPKPRNGPGVSSSATE